MKRTKGLILGGVLAALLSPCLAQEAELDVDASGFLYGTVETESGNEYTGLLRWGTEEAFWDDLFNSSKTELPYMRLSSKSGKDRREIEIFGYKIRYNWGGSSAGRQFIARFGDIKEIRPRGGDKLDVEMKSGTVYPLDGGSNDIGGEVTVDDESLGEVKLKWSRIDRITFAAAPKGVRPRNSRLYGTLETKYQLFEGYIQWDSQECLSSDKLDGDTEDGDVSIAMGKIRSIAKRNRKSSWVELFDGRKLLLDDSNDVDEDIRGIFVEDARYGRVKVSWDVFVRADFRTTGKSGKGYADYRPARSLEGSVTHGRDTRSTGRLIFDLDETESWEMLNGDLDGVEYYIPFELIRAVEPGRGDSSTIVLRSGEQLELSDGQDVTESNSGVVVLSAADKDGEYIAWDEIRRIDFE